jgi:hypothetical protein
LRVEFFTVDCEDRTRTREEEESPLLEAVARERPIKTAGWKEGLTGAVVIFKVWR